MRVDFSGGFPEMHPGRALVPLRDHETTAGLSSEHPAYGRVRSHWICALSPEQERHACVAPERLGATAQEQSINLLGVQQFGRCCEGFDRVAE